MKLLLIACIVLALFAFTHATSVNEQKDLALFTSKFRQLMTGDVDNLDLDAANPCKFNVTSFTSLKDKEFNFTDSKYKYTFTFCATTTSNALCQKAGGSLCQFDPNFNDKYENQLASWTLSPAPTATYIDPKKGKSSGYEVTFINGDPCYPTQEPRETHLLVKCAKQADISWTISEPSSCVYQVNLAHPVACSGGGDDNNGLSGGAIFLIIVFSVLAAYFLFGFLICRFKFGRTGLDSCPNRAFWCSLPGWYIAGCGFTVGKIKGCCGSKTITSSSGEYEEA